MEHLLNPDDYFSIHQDWYALVNGLRENRGDRTQLCTTHPEVPGVMATQLAATFDTRPESEFIPLGQADGTYFCQCDRCTGFDRRDHGYKICRVIFQVGILNHCHIARGYLQPGGNRDALAAIDLVVQHPHIRCGCQSVEQLT